MFGTLNCSVQRREPLKFVETTDPAAALNRGQRLKQHISCELCRKRKVRCDGNPSGCDKCTAVSVECRYPCAENRRKRASTSRSDSGKPLARNSPSGRKCSCGNQEHSKAEEKVQSPAKSPEQRQLETSTAEETAPAGLDALNSTANMGNLFDTDFDTSYSQQQMERWLLSSLGDMSSSSSGFESSSMDLDVDHFPDQLFTEQLEALNSSSDETDEGFMVADTSSGSSEAMMNMDPRPTYNNFVNLDMIAHSGAAQQNQSPAVGTVANLLGVDDKNGRGGCGCLFSTVKLLEQLEARSANRENIAIDILLGYLREALANCIKTLRCKQCASPTEQNMLLAMAARYMSTICKQTVVCYLKLRRAQQDQQHQDEQNVSLEALSKRSPQELWTGAGADGSGREGSQATNDSNNANTSAYDMWFSTYRIESSGERIQVLRCLVNVQLTEFARLLEILKARAGSRIGHLVPLNQAAKRTKSLRAMLADDVTHLA